MIQPGDPTNPEVEREAAEAFNRLWASAPELDDAALRRRVEAAVAATPQRSARPWWQRGGGWLLAPGLQTPRMATALGAAAVMVLAIVAVLATQGGTSQAAVLEEVEALSRLTEQALADDMLSADEREAIALRVASLVHLLEQDPQALAQLDDDHVARVADALDTLLVSIHSHFDDAAGPHSTLDLIAGVSSQARDEQADRAAADQDDDDDRDDGDDADDGDDRDDRDAGDRDKDRDDRDKDDEDDDDDSSDPDGDDKVDDDDDADPDEDDD